MVSFIHILQKKNRLFAKKMLMDYEKQQFTIDIILKILKLITPNYTLSLNTKSKKSMING